jgi:hypothetical protein
MNYKKYGFFLESVVVRPKSTFVFPSKGTFEAITKKCPTCPKCPLLLQQQHVQRNEARNYKWEMDIFGE